MAAKKLIVVAGGTGDLGRRIVISLLDLGAEVRVLTRASSSADASDLETRGASIVPVDVTSEPDVTKAAGWSP